MTESNLAHDLRPKQLPPDTLPDSTSNPAEQSVTRVTGVTPSNDAASAVTPPVDAGVTGVTTPPDDSTRPCFRVFDTWAAGESRRYRPGVWWFTMKETAGNTTPVDTWVCGPLHVEAVTHDAQDSNFGRLLRFQTTTGKWREWAMPMELLAADGRELRAELLSMGLHLDPQARNHLARYLIEKTPKVRMQCATQVGWSGTSFVLPDTVIGPEAARVVFQAAEYQADEYTRAGTLDGWRDAVATLARGNPLLLLALSAGFAGPLLRRCNAESGGLHLVGDSSTGKTAAIEAACSIWGGPTFKRSWRATSNGMEGAAALSNDGLLALDEISECDPREVGAIVYALGNGQGKQRASRTGNARAIKRWRCLILSNGERSIATAMQEGGHKAKAGQSVRLLDISAARTFGAWDTLHGHATGAALSDALKTAAATHYGHAGRAFLDRLTQDHRDLPAYLEQFKSAPAFAVEDGQQRRGAARMALIAMAGELATEYGVTGWEEGEATIAAVQALRAWQATRGSGPSERGQVLAQVAEFIERHGDGRFSDANGTDSRPVQNRAGWWRDTEVGRRYLFNTTAMREALRGFDFGRALDTLQAAGALTEGGGGKRSRTFRIGQQSPRLYEIDPEQLGGIHGAG
ncbi:DUF927 domain-containing protein [Haliea atlantica]